MSTYVETPPDAVRPPRPSAPPPRQTPRRRPWRRWLLLLVGLVVVASIGLSLLITPPSAGTPTVTPTAAPRTVARGRLQPVARARIATLTGGVITRLVVAAGDTVTDRQEIARIRGATGDIEVVTAPWAGTITSLPVHHGDTILAGALIATVGDLSRLQVETTDVDEYLVGRLTPGQSVTIIVDALDQRAVPGIVQSVAPISQAIGTGSDEHYPVVISLAGAGNDLRAGQTVRLRLD